MNGYSSYRTVVFLISKSAETMLNILKTYQVETEQQTGKKLKRIRMNIGHKWMNNAWKNYRQQQGLTFEFTTPYMHQHSGMAEWSMQVILNATRTMLAKSGLSQKY